MRTELLAGAVALAACSQPKTLLICHNANCVEPTRAEDDDTLPALRRSLRLVERGRPVIDGIELDSFFRGSDGACLYAHDPTDSTESTPAVAPAMELAARLAEPGPIAHADAPFQVLLELKSYVGPTTSDRHTPEQRTLHARCAWDIYTIISDAAVANGRDVHVIFESFAPELLRALIDNAPSATPTPYVFAAIQGVPAPLDNQTRPLSDYSGLPIAIVEFHAQWITDAQLEGVRATDTDVALFMFSATAETFAAIRQYEPVFVGTNEARLLRRWLDQ